MHGGEGKCTARMEVQKRSYHDEDDNKKEQEDRCVGILEAMDEA
jgi:hypothetical protein